MMDCEKCVHFPVCHDFYTEIPTDAGKMEFLTSDCRHFADADKMVQLPCKVGDTVYVPWKYAFTRGIASVQVEEIKIYDSKNHFMLLIDMQSDNEVFNQSFGGWKTDKSIGNTVFLSREEAEKALKETRK